MFWRNVFQNALRQLLVTNLNFKKLHMKFFTEKWAFGVYKTWQQHPRWIILIVQDVALKMFRWCRYRGSWCFERLGHPLALKQWVIWGPLNALINNYRIVSLFRSIISANNKMTTAQDGKILGRHPKITTFWETSNFSKPVRFWWNFARTF